MWGKVFCHCCRHNQPLSRVPRAVLCAQSNESCMRLRWAIQTDTWAPGAGETQLLLSLLGQARRLAYHTLNRASADRPV